MDTPAMESPTPPSRFRAKLAEIFGIDRRSLAAFRVAMGFLLIADLLKRALEFRAHYTDAGVAPRHLIAVDTITPRAPWMFKAYFLTGEAWGPALWFGVAAVAALALMVGYRTRLASFVSVLLLASVQLRNPLACHTGDAYLGACAFWLLFLPLGDTFSIDRLRNPSRPRLPRRYLSFGTTGLLVLILLFYLFAGFYKKREPVWTSGEALSVFVGLEAYGRPFAGFLAEQPGLSKFFTYATLALELGGPILLISPFCSRWLRLIAIALLAGFHLGIQFTVYIGIFEILSILVLVVWFPSWVWDVALPRWTPASWKRIANRWSERWMRAFTPSGVRPVPDAELAFRRPNPVLEIVALAAIVLTCTYNVRRYYDLKTHLPWGLGPVAKVLNLNQVWDIFAGIERRREGWFLVDGRLADGARVDLISGRPITKISEHEWSPTIFSNHNMRRYFINMERLKQPPFAALRGAWAEYLARQWNERETTKCVRVKVWHIGSRPWLRRDENAVELVSREPLVLDF